MSSTHQIKEFVNVQDIREMSILCLRIGRGDFTIGLEEQKPSVCEIKSTDAFSEHVLKELGTKWRKAKVEQEGRLTKIYHFFLYWSSKETKALFSFQSIIITETAKVMERSKQYDSVWFPCAVAGQQIQA